MFEAPLAGRHGRSRCSTIPPPYDRASAPAGLEVLERTRLPLGTVLIPELDAAADTAVFETTVAYLRRRLPTHPLALRIAHGSTTRAVDMAWRAGRSGIRAVLLQDEPMAPRLRSMLTRSDDLPEDLLEWLDRSGAAPREALRPAIRALVGEAADHRVGRAATRLHVPQRTLREQFARNGLPPPAGWASLARALEAALRLQRHPHASLAGVAVECGYGDQPALAHALRREFDLTPLQARALVGWEPLLGRWLSRWPDRRPAAGEDKTTPAAFSIME